jgi:shikimate dehydrogenase
MRKFGLIGYPLGHSFSKKYFTDKFDRENISDCIYENYPVSDLSNFPELINSESELCGLNVTIPYKSDIFMYLDVISPEADEIGAVNVIKIRRGEGKPRLYGYNSDITGIADSLVPYISSSARHALVLGTGGSSLAVCYVLQKLGLEVVKISRNKKAGAITYSEITDLLLKETDIIVNTTPLGMFPDISSAPPINYALLSPHHILFDLVYNPELTTFLKMGREQGSVTISGLKMLYSQAERSWLIWNDDKF